MTNLEQEDAIRRNKEIIWEQVKTLDESPIYPAIVQQVLITATEEEYYDHDLDYDEKYTEWLELRKGFIVAHLEEIGQLLGVGDCVILDIGKHTLLRAPRVTRCGLLIPLISYQGYISQPKDYLDYFDTIMTFLERYRQSVIKKSLRCFNQ